MGASIRQFVPFFSDKQERVIDLKNKIGWVNTYQIDFDNISNGVEDEGFINRAKQAFLCKILVDILYRADEQRWERDGIYDNAAAAFIAFIHASMTLMW